MQHNIYFTDMNVVHLFIGYKLDTFLRSLNRDFTLGYCLFGSKKLTKNVDLDKNGYSRYGIRFDVRSQFSFPNVKMLL